MELGVMGLENRENPKFHTRIPFCNFHRSRNVFNFQIKFQLSHIIPKGRHSFCLRYGQHRLSTTFLLKMGKDQNVNSSMYTKRKLVNKNF